MSIGIVGAGTAGLHLALLLQRRGVESTLYAERSPDEVRAGRLVNTVVHNYRTRERERLIDANHWDGSAPPIDGHWHSLPAEPRLEFPGFFTSPSLAVDYRIYQATLLEDVEERGGKVEIGAVGAADLAQLAARHELLVVSTGRGGLSELFPPVPGRSPFSEPARLIMAGLFIGIADTPDQLYVTLSIVPETGELINIPMESFDGNVGVILLECVPGGDLEALARTPYADDPAAFESLLLEKLKVHAPRVFERVDRASFGLVDASSILQGALTPTVRQGYAALDDATYAIAVGDAHVVIDPVCGLGANAASLSAFALGEAIAEGGPFDEAFCTRVDERRLPGVLAHFDFTNFMLAPQAQLGDVMGAMSQNPALSDDFTENFTDPARQLEHLASSEAAAAYIASFPQADAAGG
jgi:2-polyprenyl-6-methoxyphenol hydroxylase-like FAD-dependent oxidoreductase